MGWMWSKACARCRLKPRDYADRLWQYCTAVEAVKRGAVDYLAKPADADEIHAALMAEGGKAAHPTIPCLRIGCVGSIFSVCLNYATAMFPKQQDG